MHGATEVGVIVFAATLHKQPSLLPFLQLDFFSLQRKQNSLSNAHNFLQLRTIAFVNNGNHNRFANEYNAN